MSLENSIQELTKAINEFQNSFFKMNSNEVKVEKEDRPAPTPEVKKEQPKKAVSKPTSTPKVEPAKSKEDVYDDLDDEFGEDETEIEEIEEVKNVTSSDVKELAKQKIGAGIDRAKVKAIISESGGESIADLTQKGLNKAYAKLKAL